MQEIDPELTVADPDDDIFFCQTKSAQHINAKGGQLDICAENIFPNNVAIELKMFAQAAALLFFVAKKSADGKPFEGLLEFALVRGNDASERGREFRTQRYLALAFVGKIEKLIDNLRAALFCIQFSGLEDGAIPFNEAIAPSHFAPARENVTARRAIVGQEIAKTG